METLQNLVKAFIGESMARNRYTFYAKVAKEEGYVGYSPKDRKATQRRSGERNTSHIRGRYPLPRDRL